MYKRISRSDLVALGVFLLITFGAAGLGSVATAGSVDGWYRTLRKPALNPPNWVFGPVWTVLYIMMAVAAWQVRRVSLRLPRVSYVPALSVWGVQLALNAAWSVAFFGMRSLGGGLAIIVPLWVAIAATGAFFWQRSRTAALLLGPYLAWVTFATYLNLRLFQLNRG